VIRIGIFGIGGKMGRRIAHLAAGESDIEIVSAIEKDGHPVIGKDVGEVLEIEGTGIKVLSDIGESAGKIDCMIDFTLPGATLEHVKICSDKNIPMVIGTTGIDPEGEKAIAEASKRIPIVFSPNMAIGVNLLFNLIREASRVLGPGFSIKVDETHHVHKKDSPSGTAKMIARIIKEACGKDVPVDAVREGEVIGNHGVVFDGEYETLEIRHNAKSRDVFAAGALTAARFMAGKRRGLFSMADVLGLG